MKILFRSAGLTLFALMLAAQASAVTIKYTDRGAWEAALGSATIMTEDFDSVTPANITSGTTSIGMLSIEAVNAGGLTQINDGTGARNINGTNYLQLITDSIPIRSATLHLPNSSFAWGMDYNQYGDQTYVTFADIVADTVGPHGATGFVGYISDIEFNEIQFTDPHPSLALIGMDNFSFVESEVPEPTTLAILGLGLAGIGFGRRKRLG